ncbi:MAG TPA: L-arabinose isomerase, partial [Flavilitoribacter sp.]|nr:L-arabinose isomerase [Flavilitoribacter sp.]
MIDFNQYEAWFITGSQHLYGPKTLKQVEEHSKKIVSALNRAKSIPVKVVFKTVLTTPDEISNLIRD